VVRIAGEIQRLILEMASENPRWGYTRIQGGLANLGFTIGRNTIKRVLAENGLTFSAACGMGLLWSGKLILPRLDSTPAVKKVASTARDARSTVPVKRPSFGTLRRRRDQQ